MPSQPTIYDVHVDRPLSDMAILYRNDPTSYLGTRMAPAKPVPNKSDKYAVWTRADMFRDQMAVRAPNTESAGSGFGVTYSTFVCEDYSLHKDISDMERANEDAEINLDTVATLFLADQGQIKLDRMWASAAFTTNIWTGSTTGGDLVGGTNFLKFSSAGSTPIEVIRTQVWNLRLAGVARAGMKLAIGPLVWETLADHPELVARLPVTELRSVQEQTLATLLGIGEVCIGESVYNSAAPGATASYNFISGNNMLLSYVAPPGLNVPTSAVTFYWNGWLGNAALGPMGGTARIKKFRREELECDRVEISESFVVQITAPDLGVFFSQVT